jgi:hypothetical protein
MNDWPGKLTLEYAVLFLADHLIVLAEAAELGHHRVGATRLVDDLGALELVGSESALAARALRGAG